LARKFIARRPSPRLEKPTTAASSPEMVDTLYATLAYL
jgi:hypothetical protein